MGLRAGDRSLHLRHAGDTQATGRRRSAGFWARRTRFCTVRVLMRTADCLKHLLDAEDAVISDELNHASIIDGVRLSKRSDSATERRYGGPGSQDCEEGPGKPAYQLIATDGVFSMDGYIARASRDLRSGGRIRRTGNGGRLARGGFMGRSGRGTHEHCGVEGRVDILTGTLGKALGGASGGYASGRKEIIELLRQRSRPYSVFELRRSADCGGVAEGARPAVCVAPVARAASSEYALFPGAMQGLGFSIPPGEHPIVPVMIGDAVLAGRMADLLLGARCLRNWVFLSGCAAGQGSHSRADVGGAYKRRSGVRGRAIRPREARTGNLGQVLGRNPRNGAVEVLGPLVTIAKREFPTAIRSWRLLRS